MQAGQEQRNVLSSVHQVVQSNVTKMYKKIDDIIQSAKTFVEERPENGQKIVDHVTSYTKYMHKVIEQIIESYSELLQNAVFGEQNPIEQVAQNGRIRTRFDAEQGNSQEQGQEGFEDNMADLLQEFKEKFAQNIERAKNATTKIQSLLSPLVQ